MASFYSVNLFTFYLSVIIILISGPRGIMPTQQNAQINLIIDQWLNPHGHLFG